MSSAPVLLFAGMAALAMVPFALLMVTAFVRIVVVLSIVRSAVGTPQLPPTQVITGLALVLTLAVMAPTGERMYLAAAPALAGRALVNPTSGESLASAREAVTRAIEPLRDWLLRHTHARDRASFYDLAIRARSPEESAGITDRDMAVLVPAFLTTELRKAFEMGFLILLPFLVVDLVVANLLLALGLHGLSAATVALPFKLLLFVLADGWHLVVRGLLESYV